MEGPGRNIQATFRAAMRAAKQDANLGADYGTSLKRIVKAAEARGLPAWLVDQIRGQYHTTWQEQREAIKL